MTSMVRRISLAHLSMIGVSPVALVSVAAAAGFDDVGLRLVPTASGIDHGVLEDAAALSALATAVSDAGVGVLDVEVIRIREPEAMADPRPLLEAGATLGARYAITTLEDPDPVRRADSLARVAEQAAAVGMVLSVEYMLFSAAADLAAAVEAVRASGSDHAVVLADVLHHTRSGGVPDDLRSVAARLLPYAQVCGAEGSGAARDAASARAEAIGARRLPDEGDLPVAAFIRALPPGAGISVEAPLPGIVAPEDPREHAVRLRASVERVLA